MRFRSLRTPAIAGAASLFALAACNDVTTPSAPLAPTSVARSATTTGQLLTAVANGKRYRDAGLKPATGRSGSATLLTRALFNKNGSTDLEVTTGGSLDGAPTAPGNLNKVQVKAFSAASTAPIFTKNYNGLSAGGRAAYSYGSIGRGARFQVQANIGGIDGKRTDVVTVTETAKARPDIAVSDVTAPGQAFVNAHVMISATVRELNGDVGATDNCVLYADGIEIDRINNQWVDAAGTVGCTFNHVFSTIGVKALEVRAEHVVPGDWDTANNVATASVTIVDPITPLHGAGYAQQLTGNYEQGYSYDYYDSGHASTSVIPQYNKQVYASESAYLYGQAQTGSDQVTSASITISSGGTVLGSATLPLNGYCAYNQDAAGFFAYLCNDYYYGGFFQVGHSSNQATYYSLYYNAYYDAPSGQYVYTAAPDVSFSSSGTPLPQWGADLKIDAKFTSASNTYQALATTTLEPYAYDYNAPYTCYSDYYYYYYNYCSGYKQQESGLRGWFNF
jgi:hypothetical protein